MKQYTGEPAIISLTSWKGRIKYAGKTIFSLLKNCPGFHIVLVLSSDEFRRKECDLPSDLRNLITNNIIEILWVKKNYKSFKKILFTMMKYPDVPIISADDDMFYKWNYAKRLYDVYIKTHAMVSCTASYKLHKVWPHGYAVLYPPSSLLHADLDIIAILDTLMQHHCTHDDGLLARLYYRNSNVPMAIGLHLQWPDVASVHTPITLENGISLHLTKEEAEREYELIETLLAPKTNSSKTLINSPHLIIGNNCCGGNFYQKKGILYNNPFIWMVVPYDSMAILMTQFSSIRWEKIALRPSSLRPNTFILNVDNKIDIHYVHHEYNPNYSTPTLIKNSFGSHLASSQIWTYVVKKYVQRVKEMAETNMHPMFIVHDQVWGDQKLTIDDLIKIKCNYKRVFVTDHYPQFNYDKENTKIIYSAPRLLPEPMIHKYFSEINTFLFD